MTFNDTNLTVIMCMIWYDDEQDLSIQAIFSYNILYADVQYNVLYFHDNILWKLTYDGVFSIKMKDTQ